ncbi:hypothetical protein IAG41_16010 [Sphingomonas sp. JC676]|uniref:hypothetical protein n=1 Tax=Sphingomonas sp. JC676 TaxID=2768065 RepID=UPI001657D82B|nr:hypothetical protein [Sphingomonas sp. JC676]MBC9033898.1 hypothetical protein [Sphingomonas sp. JC676]
MSKGQVTGATDRVARKGGTPGRRKQAPNANVPAMARRTRLDRAVGQVGANPLAAALGVAALSAGLALLLPAGRRESEVMGEVADKLGDAARDAADTVVAAGRAQVETLAQSALVGVGGAVIQAVVSNADADGGKE